MLAKFEAVAILYDLIRRKCMRECFSCIIAMVDRIPQLWKSRGIRLSGKPEVGPHGTGQGFLVPSKKVCTIKPFPLNKYGSKNYSKFYSYIDFWWFFTTTKKNKPTKLKKSKTLSSGLKYYYKRYRMSWLYISIQDHR